MAPSALTTRWSDTMRQRTESLVIPLLNLNNSITAELNPGVGSSYNPDRGKYLGPSQPVQRIANTVAFGGKLLDPPRMGVNSSYFSTMFAPSVSCSDRSEDFYQQFKLTEKWLFDTTVDDYGASSILFAAWSESKGFQTPGLNISGAAGSLVTLMNSTMHPGVSAYSEDLTYPAIRKTLEFSDPSSIYFAIGEPNLQAVVHTTLWQCSLYNSSYDLEISSDSSGQQTVNIRNVTNINTVDPISSGDDINALGSIIGSQAILDAFAQILDGIIFGSSGYFNYGSMSTTATKILQTSLIQNKHIWNISNIYDGSFRFQDMDLTTSVGNDFGKAVEELFHNITVSMMSWGMFRVNMSEEVKPTTSDVLFSSPYIVYHYQPRNLVLAYGIAGALSAILAAIGELLIFSSGCSFSTNFSSIMRATRSEHIDTLIGLEHRTAEEPLPTRIAEATLHLGRSAKGEAEVLIDSNKQHFRVDHDAARTDS